MLTHLKRDDEDGEDGNNVRKIGLGQEKLDEASLDAPALQNQPHDVNNDDGDDDDGDDDDYDYDDGDRIWPMSAEWTEQMSKKRERLEAEEHKKHKKHKTLRKKNH